MKTVKRSMKLMGCGFDITMVAENKLNANRYITMAVNEMKRIENLISSWDSKSQTSAVNRNAGIRPVQVDKELFDLIQRALWISKVTDGAFDVSYASMDRLWKFDGSMTELPSPLAISRSVAKVGYQKVILSQNDQTVFLAERGMKIGFGGIGKGYAADKAKSLLMAKGAIGGIINASGDMNTWGRQSNGDDWNIAITNPLNKEVSYGVVPLKKGAVVTSGNYVNYAMLKGKKYSHTIDPRTGMPAEGIMSTTVFSQSAELADALATSLSVMGTQVALDRINQLQNIECIIIDDDGQIHTSNNISIQQS